MTQRAEAAAVADAYVALSDDGRRNFLLMLARDFWTDSGTVDDAIDALKFGDDRRTAERRLREALAPPADRLLRLMAALEGGVKFLVDLRADLLRVANGDAELADLDRELKAHLATMFDVGLLTLRRITWEAPAALLEKLIAYEAVHAISSWDDLKNRLDSDRRCFAFFHPAMPDEPLVFVEIALTTGIATELPPLLDARAPELDLDRADTAVFLFDLQLSTRARRGQPRHCAYQASGRSAPARPAPAAPVRHTLTDPGLSNVGRARARGRWRRPAGRGTRALAGRARARAGAVVRPRMGRRRGNPASTAGPVRPLPHDHIRRSRR